MFGVVAQLRGMLPQLHTTARHANKIQSHNCEACCHNYAQPRGLLTKLQSHNCEACFHNYAQLRGLLPQLRTTVRHANTTTHNCEACVHNYAQLRGISHVHRELGEMVVCRFQRIRFGTEARRSTVTQLLCTASRTRRTLDAVYDDL